MIIEIKQKKQKKTKKQKQLKKNEELALVLGQQ